MKKLICVFIMLMFGASAFAECTLPEQSNLRVIDGDTIDTGLIVLGNTKPIHIRLIGLDTPELRGKCQKEKDLAKEAKQFLQHALDTYPNEVKIVYKGWDKFGGRVLADVFVHDVNVTEELIRRNMAVPYQGGKKVKDWCK